MENTSIKTARCTECTLLKNNQTATCNHDKNAYCQVFLFRAKNHAKEFNMHPSIHKVSKSV